MYRKLFLFYILILLLALSLNCILVWAFVKDACNCSILLIPFATNFVSASNLGICTLYTHHTVLVKVQSLLSKAFRDKRLEAKKYCLADRESQVHISQLCLYYRMLTFLTPFSVFLWGDSSHQNYWWIQMKGNEFLMHAETKISN